MRFLLFFGMTAGLLHAGEVSQGPILTAAIFGNVESLRSLLAAGGQPCAKGFDGQCAIVSAIQNRHTACAELLWEAGCRDMPELAYRISQNATPDDVRAALANGAKAEPEESAAVTPLAVAAGAGKLAIVKILVESGAGEKQGFTLALGAAAGGGHHEVVDYLLLVGAKPDVSVLEGAIAFSNPDGGGWTKEDCERTLDLLLGKVKLGELSETEQHQLLLAAVFPRNPENGPEVFQKLIANGLNPRARDKTGKSIKEILAGNPESSTPAIRKFLSLTPGGE